jgi:hypothetical protein
MKLRHTVLTTIALVILWVMLASTLRAQEDPCPATGWSLGAGMVQTNVQIAAHGPVDAWTRGWIFEDGDNTLKLSAVALWDGRVLLQAAERHESGHWYEIAEIEMLPADKCVFRSREPLDELGNYLWWGVVPEYVEHSHPDVEVEQVSPRAPGKETD